MGAGQVVISTNEIGHRVFAMPAQPNNISQV